MDLLGQFHQHLHVPFAQYFCAKKLQSQNVTREKLYKALSYKKISSEMLIGSISSMFYKQLSCTQIPNAHKRLKTLHFFALLGSALVKAACRMWVKLTPCRCL